MGDPNWAKHAADILRRNDIRMFATVPDYIVSHVLEHLSVEKGRAEGRLDRDVVGHCRRFRRALAASPAG